MVNSERGAGVGVGGCEKYIRDLPSPGILFIGYQFRERVFSGIPPATALD